MKNNNYWIDCSGLPPKHCVIQVKLTEDRQYVITFLDKNREVYFLFEKIGDKFVKLGQNKNPLTLVSKYIDKQEKKND